MMNNRYFERIKKNYLEGYGMPKKHYSAADLDNFVQTGLLTPSEKQEILAVKEG